MRGANRRVIDGETGEITRYVVEPGPSRRGRARDSQVHYGAIYLPALATFVDADDLTAAELRVLLRLIAQAPLGECQQVSQTRLARTLRLHRNTISRALDGLIGRHVVIRDPDDPGCLWVDPELFWRGYLNEREPVRSRLSATG